MSSKTNDKIKNSMELKKEISQVFVANNSKLKPYLEIFQHNPENIVQQPLGILIGFFEVKEYSDDSAYIVNFLNSVLKKEYYANPKKSISESFDSALHKINLALSEIAKHGNVNWLGKLDAAICVIEKNSIYFSSTGKAKILIFRKDSLSGINDDFIQEEVELHPIKTFVNVSTGRLEKDDKFIITSENIFNIFSVRDLEKNIFRLPGEKFVQFLKTALTNELDLAGTIIVDIFETKPSEKILPSNLQKNSSNLNFFSEKTFSKKKNGKKTSSNEKIVATPLPAENLDEKNEYVDKKTGHIYIQETEKQNHNNDNENLRENFSMVTEIFAIFFHNLKAFFKKQSSLAWRKISRKIKDARQQIKHKNETILIQKQESEKEKTEEAPEIISNENPPTEKETPKKKEFIPQKNMQERLIPILDATKEVLKKSVSLARKISRFSFEYFQKISSLLPKKNITGENSSQKQETEIKKTFFIFPNISVIKKLFHSFNNKQKLYATTLILVILLTPLIYLKIFNKNETENNSPAQIVPPELSAIEKFSQEKNIIFTEKPKETFDVANAIEILALDNSIISISADKVTVINRDKNESKDFLWPTEFGKAKKTTYMKDLNIFLIMTDQKKIISFSPISLEFKDNAIQFPSDYELGPIATYLTYIYLLDSKNNQIHRYPRAEGGFGTGITWLRETMDLSKISDMAIDENLYLAEKKSIKKLFQGKTVELSLEKSNTPINFDHIFTNITLDHIYALDKENSRVIQFNKNGNIIKQYHNEIIGNATEFSVDEKNKKIYIATSENISVIELQ